MSEKMKNEPAAHRSDVFVDLFRLVGAVVVGDDVKRPTFGSLAIDQLEKRDDILTLVRFVAFPDDCSAQHVQCRL